MIDIASAKLIKISRTPVSREWTSNKTTGTSSSDQAFAVETSESIGFRIGAIITAHIAEEDTAKFLYNYTAAQLEEVLDTNIRNFISAELATSFGAHDLNWGQKNKNDVFANARLKAQDFFGKRGITIDNFGFSEGIYYDNQKIQDAIDDKFSSEMKVVSAQNMLDAAKKLAESQVAVEQSVGRH